MFGVTELWLFVLSGVMLNLIPGPDSLYVIGRSAGQGFRAGSVGAFGIGAGTLVHVFAAAFGLSAILATSAMAFTVVKVIGCIYLLYIGFSMLLSKNKAADVDAVNVDSKNTSLSQIFFQGFLTNVLNPKVALFFLAFVPQFIAMDYPHKAMSFIFLGIIFNINAMIWCHILAWSSSSIGGKLKNNQRLTTYLTKFTGALFLFFGIKLALSKQS
ncbi:MAG: LysE family translocator [Moritella sp.]|uniref:LysE family translocator n=1 Tax=unclassified Moritella TaxID=2637987 RepID=UPI0001569DE5|nr:MULTISPECIES: LysE family translocator [unclassified Moritella]EDM64769.1 transporter transmembrane protein-putative threonine efflux protein [Moritella sp. PE36]MBL1415263.1 LysE family translocator [Moritella sp.]PHR90207.1 MAG: LysE family translocator [Moritella sp.]